MRWLSKLLVLIAVMAAAGYTFERVQACRIAFVPAAPPASPAVPATTSARPLAGDGKSSLLYPGSQVEAQLKLGYETLQTYDDGSFTVVPLPPHSALTTTLQLETTGRSSPRIGLADSKCGAPVEVAVYRPDGANSLFSYELSNQQHRSATDIDMSADSYPGLILITVKMADGAASNWWCSVHFVWDAVP